MEVNLYNLSMVSEERVCGEGGLYGEIVCPASAQQVRDRASP